MKPWLHWDSGHPSPSDQRRGRPSAQCKFRHGGGSRVTSVACDNCGKSYLHYKKRVEAAKRHYCSVACQKAGRTLAANPKWRGGRKTRHCEACNAVFTVRAGTPEHQGRFCSHACRGKKLRIFASAKECIRAHQRRRRARKRSAGKLLGHHTESEWLALLATFDGACATCGVRDRITRDHIIPLSKGGSDLIENIQPLCVSCNCKKFTRMPNVA